VSKRRLSPQERTIYEITLYIRATRVHHAVTRRSERERKAAAVSMEMWRGVCWERWRLLYEGRQHMTEKTPWAFFSIRSNVKCG
jgi:hypothetical protein